MQNSTEFNFEKKCHYNHIIILGAHRDGKEEQI